MRRVCWLHVSDFHFKAEDDPDRRQVLAALLRDVKRLCQEDGIRISPKKSITMRPDFVFITGDVAFSAKEDEYRAAGEYMPTLWASCGWHELHEAAARSLSE